MGTGSGRSYVSTTGGAGAVGSPIVNGISFFDSTHFGCVFAHTGPILGGSENFSLGVEYGGVAVPEPSTLALFQCGREPWKKWNEAIRLAVLDHQEADGSWPPVGPHAEVLGRVGATALPTATAEVYYRYTRIFSTGR